MSGRRILRLLPVLAIVAAGTGFSAAQAQDASQLSAEELNELFQGQRTRGLVLAPAGGDAAAPAAAETSVAPAPASAPSYTQIDPAVQVNIRVSFDFDSASLRDSEKAKLSTLCEVMLTSDIEKFRIVGHTDATGSVSYNERLSLLRAEEVKRHMVDDCGVPESRLEAVGVGMAYPFDSADPNSEINRRVEFQVVS